MPFVQRVIEPKFLSRTSLSDADGKPRVTDNEFAAVTNNTLSNALRQLASLALAANDIFVDLTNQLQYVAQRSDVLKNKIVVLEEKVTAFDPKKVAVPVSNICTFALLKQHYAAKHNLTTSLFSADTRPSAVKELYEAAAKTPISVMRQMDRWRRDGHRSSRFFVCTPVLGAKRREIRKKVDIDIETRMPAAVEELRRWTSAEALGDITVTPDCPNRIAPNVTLIDGNATDGAIASDDEAIDHKLPSPEEQVQVIALKFPAEIVAVDVSGRAFNRMSLQRRSLLHGDLNNQTEREGTTLRIKTRTRKPRNRRRNTLAGTDQKEIQSALISGEEPCSSANNAVLEVLDNGAVFRSKSSEPLRYTPKKDSSLDNKKSHFYSLKQWGKSRLKMISKSSDCNKTNIENNKFNEDESNIYETVSSKRKRGLNRERRLTHERKPSYSSSEKSSINLPLSTPLSTTIGMAVKLRESSAQRRLKRIGGNKDEPHSSSGNWSASSESGRASIGSEITSTTQPKSSTSAATSNNSLNQHPPSSVNSKRRFNINTSGSSSITSEGTLTPDIHDFHEDGETSSVYSCDTEGYYTSFHMDSGLKTLKEEDTPVTPLHSSTAFSNCSSSNTMLTAENEYELFGKGSTSTTASSAGTVCTTLKATGSCRSLIVGPAVPERKSSLSKISNKDKSLPSSLEREFGSDKTGTVKRSPASSNKSTIIAVVHQQIDGDVSPDSGHNTSSSPIESANSPSGVRSGSEFEFSECSDMEGPDRIERIRVKTTINSSRIPSMCVITPPHSDDESVKGLNIERKNRHNSVENYNLSRKDWQNSAIKPMETDIDTFEFADSESEDLSRTRFIKLSNNGTTKLQRINVNPHSGYATLESVNARSCEKIEPPTKMVNTTSSNVRAPSPSGGTVTIKEDASKQCTQPILKATLLPFNNVLDKLKSNFINFSKKETKLYFKSVSDVDEDSGDYVTIADVRNSNEKGTARSETKNNVSHKVADTEYVSLNELPCNINSDLINMSATVNDSLERKRRQGARVTLNAEGRVVYSSDSLRRTKGAHTTFEPGPYVKEIVIASESPLPLHRIPKCVRPVQNSQEQYSGVSLKDSRPLSPQLGKVVIRAASGLSSPTAEIVRVPPSTIVTPTIRPISPKPNTTRGAYVQMQDARGSLPASCEKEPVYSPSDQPNTCKNWVMENSSRQTTKMPDAYGYQNPLLDSNIPLVHASVYTRNNQICRTLPSKKTQFIIENSNFERPITPDIMRGLPSNRFNSNSPSKQQNLRYHSDFPEIQNNYQKLGIPIELPQVKDLYRNYEPQVPSLSYIKPQTHQQSIITNSSHTENVIEISYSRQGSKSNSLASATSCPEGKQTSLNDSLKISPIDPRNTGGFQSSTPSSKCQYDLKSAINLETKLLSPKKSTMSTEELYAVIHKGKKKMNIQTTNVPAASSSPVIFSPNRCKSPELRVKSPETGYFGEKTRSRFSWSPSDGEYVDYNTNIDKLSPNTESGTRQSWACSDRKGNQQTSRLDFKKLLLQHSTKSNISPGSKKVSAVEQLKLSKQMHLAKNTQSEMHILELSGSPKTLQNRRLNNLSGSPKHISDKQRSIPKLISPRSQWRFTSPRSDVLSSTIPEDCGEDENSGSSLQRRNILSTFKRPENLVDDTKYSTNSTAIIKEEKKLVLGTSKSRANILDNVATDKNMYKRASNSSITQHMQAQRAQFFGSLQPNDQNSSSTYTFKSSKEKSNVTPPTLETAF